MLEDDDMRVVYLQPPRSGFPWGWLVLVFVFLVLLGVAFRLYLVQQLFTAFSSVDRGLQSVSRSYPGPVPVYPAGASQAFPPSSRLRLSGHAASKGRQAFIATSASGAYVLIPASRCQVLDGGPVCHYQGKTVTRYTGTAPP